jgi:CheY-like chemotaxis protein
MKLNVLLIDDDNIVLFLHKTLAKLSGFTSEAILCENGKEAFDYLHSHDVANTTFLLVLDINMPYMNGWELIDAINKEKFSAQIFVVIVTSSINTADQEKAKSYKQVIDFRIKPITIDALTEMKQLAELKQFF